jgi:hypothetical protein
MKRLLVMFSFIALIGVMSLHADTIAYTDPDNTTYTFLDPNWNFALAFTVNAPITVTALGVFNLDGSGVIHGPVQVGIFLASGSGAEVTPTVTFAGTYTPAGLGYDVFQPITPVVLQPGLYLVNEVGLNAGGYDHSGNRVHGATGPIMNSGGGLLSFNEAYYDFNSTFDNPFLTSGTCPSCPPPPVGLNVFDAGTFEFHGATTPEPSSILLFSSGLVSLLPLSRRLRRVVRG